MTPWPPSFLAKMQSPIQADRAVLGVGAPLVVPRFGIAQRFSNHSPAVQFSSGPHHLDRSKAICFRSNSAASVSQMSGFLNDGRPIETTHESQIYFGIGFLGGNQPPLTKSRCDSTSESRANRSISLTSELRLSNRNPIVSARNRWLNKGESQMQFHRRLQCLNSRRPTPFNSSRFFSVINRDLNDRDHTNQNRNHEKNHADQCVAIRGKSDCDHRRRTP